MPVLAVVEADRVDVEQREIAMALVSEKVTTVLHLLIATGIYARAPRRHQWLLSMDWSFLYACLQQEEEATPHITRGTHLLLRSGELRLPEVTSYIHASQCGRKSGPHIWVSVSFAGNQGLTYGYVSVIHCCNTERIQRTIQHPFRGQLMRVARGMKTADILRTSHPLALVCYS